MLNENISWDYMVTWLQGVWRNQDDVELVALVSAKAAGRVSPGTVHKKLTK
jgi:hypothetical protein